MTIAEQCTKAQTALDVLDEAKRTYVTMVITNRWPPAGNIIDKTSAPQLNSTPIPSYAGMNDAQIHALVQSQATKLSKANSTCNNCGKKGHWAAECRGPRKTDDKPADTANETTADKPAGRGRRQRNEKGWRAVHPKEGESVLHTSTHKGTTIQHYFCRTCNKWCKHIAKDDAPKHPNAPVHDPAYRRNKQSGNPATPQANLVMTSSDGIPFLDYE